MAALLSGPDEGIDRERPVYNRHVELRAQRARDRLERIQTQAVREDA
jgi:hypothetical protein